MFLGLPVGKCGSFLAAHNVLNKLTAESQSGTPTSPAETASVTYGEEMTRYTWQGKQLNLL